MTEAEFLAAYLARFGNPLLMSREVLLSQHTPDMVEYLAQVDTHPKGGDALAAPFMGIAVPKGCAHD